LPKLPKLPKSENGKAFAPGGLAKPAIQISAIFGNFEFWAILESDREDGQARL